MGLFCSAAFLNVIAASASVGFIAEYWNGAWVALNTNSLASFSVFSSGGSDVFSLEQPTDWAVTDPNPAVALGVTGYWFRIRRTGAAVATPPQITSPIYSINTSAIYTRSSELESDLPLLIKLELTNQSDSVTALGPPPVGLQTEFNNFILGVRKVERGDNFSARINLSDEQNPLGVSFITTAGVAIGTASDTITGRAYTYTAVAASAMATRLTISINSSYISEWLGKYHFYLVCSGTAADFQLRIQTQVGSYGKISISDTKQLTSSGIIDIGVLDFGGNERDDVDFFSGSIAIQAACLNAGGSSLRLEQLVLIPVDELALECNSITTTTLGGAVSGESTYVLGGQKLIIDSVGFPKEYISSWVETSAGYKKTKYITKSPFYFFLNSNTNQKIWTFFNTLHELVCTVTIEKVQRYFSMCGDR